VRGLHIGTHGTWAKVGGTFAQLKEGIRGDFSLSSEIILLAQMHACTHTYAHTRAHTQTHTHTHSLSLTHLLTHAQASHATIVLERKVHELRRQYDKLMQVGAGWDSNPNAKAVKKRGMWMPGSCSCTHTPTHSYARTYASTHAPQDKKTAMAKLENSQDALQELQRVKGTTAAAAAAPGADGELGGVAQTRAMSTLGGRCAPPCVEQPFSRSIRHKGS